MERIHLGTCSWKYNSWEGIIYPDKGEYDYLVEYSKHYDTVEVDQWFWSLFGTDKVKLPEPEIVDEYRRAVPKGFKFSVKVPNSITLTHFYTHGKPKGTPLEINPYFLSIDLFNRFLEKMEALGEKIGIIMFQFEYLNKQKMESQRKFVERLETFFNEIPRSYPYAIEIRNPNYLNKVYFEALGRLNLYHVFVQGYYMPHVKNIFDSYRGYIKDKTVIRLMGSDRPGIEQRTGNKWNRIVDDRDGELIDIVDIIRELVKHNIEIYINVNNHYEGSAPLTIRKIIEKIRMIDSNFK